MTLQGCLTFERLLVPADSSTPRRRLCSRRTRARLEHRSQPTRTRLRHGMFAHLLPEALPAFYIAPRISLPPQVCPLNLARHSCSRRRSLIVTHEQVLIARKPRLIHVLIPIDTTSPRPRAGRGNSVIQRDAVLGAERFAQRFGTREVFCCASARRSVVGRGRWRARGGGLVTQEVSLFKSNLTLGLFLERARV